MKLIITIITICIISIGCSKTYTFNEMEKKYGKLHEIDNQFINFSNDSIKISCIKVNNQYQILCTYK